MLKSSDILKSITLILSSNFDNDVYTSRELVENGNFFVELDNVRTNKYFYNQNRSLTARIYYKASTKNNFELELLEIHEELEEIFNLKLEVDARYLNTTDFLSRIVEDTLYFSFNVEYFDSDYVESGENIEHLVIGGI
jgi:hypothetical protein